MYASLLYYYESQIELKGFSLFTKAEYFVTAISMTLLQLFKIYPSQESIALPKCGRRLELCLYLTIQ